VIYLLKILIFFRVHGQAINRIASRNVKVLVVGNPANTNCYVCRHFAPSIPAKNFSALTRLDHNRAVSEVANRINQNVSNVKNLIIWGNHSDTQFPDVSHGYVAPSRTPLRNSVNNEEFLQADFLTFVQKRGGAVIAKRGFSSALSAAKAICDHMRDWVHGTREGEFVSMAVSSDGSYGIPAGLIFSFPCTCSNGEYHIVQGLGISDFARSKMDITMQELMQERDIANDLTK